MDWKVLAARYYFDGLSIEDVAVLVDKSRQSVSAHLKKLPGYREERERRKAANAKKRREYKTAKQRTYRATGMMAVTAETMRREHDLAALELSREIYH